MNTYLFELHREKPIAKAEVKSVVLQIDKDTIFEEQNENNREFLLVNMIKELPNLTKKLAYTHNIYEFVCFYNDESLNSANWKKTYRNNFAVRSIDKEVIDKISKAVWTNVDNPKVKLDNSDTDICVFLGKVFVLRQRISTDALKRKNQNRPIKNPVSLSPLLAMAMVNLTGGNMVYDPFCGTGGILIEAALLGKKIIGSDISYQMVKGTEINLKHFNITNFNLFRADATKHKFEEQSKVDAIICDPPYGQASRLYGTKSEDIYRNFLKNIKNLVREGGDLVVIFPSYMDYKKIIEESNLKIKEKFEEYIHINLTRAIVHITV